MFLVLVVISGLRNDVMTVLRYLPFLISFRDDEHPEGYERQEDIKGQYAEHPEAFLSHSARGDIDDDCLHNPTEQEEGKGYL